MNLIKKTTITLVLSCLSSVLLGQISTTGLTGYWPFSGFQLANDYSGNNNDGIIHGATLTDDRFGNCNQAYKFNGLNNFIEILSSPTVDMNNIDFTITCWIKTYKNDTTGIVLNKKLHNGSYNGYVITTNDNDLGYCPTYKHGYFYVAAGAHQEVCSDNAICDDTSWHFLTGVYKQISNQTYFYVDNILQSTIGQASGSPSNNTNLFFGGAGDVNLDYFTGVIDAVRIYQRALNSVEITQLFNEPDPGAGLGTGINTVKDTSICASSTASLHAIAASSYTWSTGSNTQTITINNSGTYWVQILPLNGCKQTDTIHVNLTSPPTFNLVKDTSICDSPIVLDIKDSSLNVNWSNGSHSNQTTITSAGVYSVSVSKNGCKSTGVVTVKNALYPTSIAVPNIITPNGDGINDLFEFNTNGLIVIGFNLYNRWGKLVYSITNSSVIWDGKQENNLIDDGIYFWTATFANPCKNISESIKQQGFLTVLK